MRIPETPPRSQELWERVLSNPSVIQAIFESVAEPMVAGKYLHWDTLKYHGPPQGIDLHAWWLGLKLRRQALEKRIPLLDKSGAKFHYCMVDPLQEDMQYIDSLSHGTIQMPEQVTNPETKNRYIVRSLIEESITSSQLEGASTTREVAKEMIRQGRPPRNRSEQMILDNFRTMLRIGELRDEKLTRDLVFEIHRLVSEGTLRDSRGGGRFRRRDERVVVMDDYGVIYHEPPDASQLDDRLARMCEFANAENARPYIHPAIRSMILHFWLAYDHPFVDGNGRTARALFYWSMLKYNYWLFEFISISDIILKSHSQYGRAFLYTETDSNDLTYFLIYHSQIIHKAINKLRDYIGERSRRMAQVQAALKGTQSLNYRQRELIMHALRHPGFMYTYESHRISHGVVRQTARTDLLGLVRRGLLEKTKIGKAWCFVPARDLEKRLEKPE
jgi:Fic family protein